MFNIYFIHRRLLIHFPFDIKVFRCILLQNTLICFLFPQNSPQIYLVQMMIQLWSWKQNFSQPKHHDLHKFAGDWKCSSVSPETQNSSLIYTRDPWIKWNNKSKAFFKSSGRNVFKCLMSNNSPVSSEFLMKETERNT